MAKKVQYQSKYLADFLREVKEAAFRRALENFGSGMRRIISDAQIEFCSNYCSVHGVRMARVWGVTNATANRRLQKLDSLGVRRKPRYGKSHCDSYDAITEIVEGYLREAIEYWKTVGYSQTELRDAITIEGENDAAKH